MPVRDGHQTLSALEVELAVQFRLPPGFRVFATRLRDWGILEMQFSYCDQHKYLSIRLDGDLTAKDLDKLADDLAQQIELTPIIDTYTEGTVATIVRCLQARNEAGTN